MTAETALRRFTRRLRQDTSGLALLEFAFSAPIVLGIGMYGVEISSLALANMRVSQAALNIADNASRLGFASTLNQRQFREVDITDVVSQIRQQTNGWGLTTRGRVTITSLEERDGRQVMHWQRCVGEKIGLDYASHYGAPETTAGSEPLPATPGKEPPDDGGTLGMGPADAKVKAPPKSGVIFVEVNYDYQPVVSEKWLPAGTTRLRYIASFIVRDRRELTQLFNPEPKVKDEDKFTCDRYST